MIRSLLTEYGLPWVLNRVLYSTKLKMLRAIPISENVFEKTVQVERIDIFDLKVEPIEEFLKKLPESKKSKIISIANKAIEGKIFGFSSLELDYGSPIKWHLHPLTHKEVDSSLKWYQIPDFDAQRGDIKVIWEASRFTHFFFFIRAFMLTKDRKYYDAFSIQLNDWLQKNQYSYGPNYKCGQEATLRMINTLITYSAFKAYGLTSQKDEENVRKIIEFSYKKVLSNFFYAHKCIKNNHTLSEITGLIIGAWACKNNKRLKKAYELLNKEIQKQFLIDGGYIQYSFNYQRFALQLMEFILNISKQTKLQISEQSKQRIKQSAYLLYQMQDESGDVPNYGSNDGALIFPVTSCGYRDFRPVVNTIFGLIEGTRLFEQGEYDEELLWFGGKPLAEIPISKIERTSSSFNHSGYYSIRHKDGFLMIVLQDYKTRPAQMDQLHFDLWHKGRNIFCDSGTYSYASEIGNHMALTSAHNTVKIPKKEQMNKYGPFLVYNWTKAKNVRHSKNTFIGTMISKNGYEHTRRIEKNDRGYTIIDHVVSGNEEYCDFNFHTPCTVKVTTTGFELYDEGICLCKVMVDGHLNIEVNKTYRSLYYLRKEEISCVIVKGAILDRHCNLTFNIELL